MSSPLTALATAKRLGIIVPSSNTAVETLTISILRKANIIPIFTRIRVLTLGTDSATRDQFSQATFIEAAKLLADAEPDVIIWNGTSGMFVGGDLEADRQLAKAMTDASGVPCTTNTLATIEALNYLGITDVSIAVPYTPALTEKLRAFFTSEGFNVHKALCMDQTPASNIEIAKCGEETIIDVIKRSVTPETRAVLVACTNWPATLLSASIERDLGIYVLDSIAVSAWHSLRMLGYSGGVGDLQAWGKLLASL